MRPKNLRRITAKFGQAYDRSKKYEERKKNWQTEFFAACTQTIQRERRLPRRTVAAPDKATALKMNPGWRVIMDDPIEGTYLLEKDPALVPYTYINPDDGMVYQRGTQESGPSLDDERLQEEDPDLWYSITKMERVVKDPSTWTEEQLAAVQPYMIPGSIKARLVPPRKAKPEELEQHEQSNS